MAPWGANEAGPGRHSAPGPCCFCIGWGSVRLAPEEGRKLGVVLLFLAASAA